MAGGYSRPYCKACNVKRRSTLVLFALRNGKLESVMPSWKGKGANICDECTTLKQDLMSEEIFGCLNPGYSVEYYNASKKSSHAERFAHDGFVVLSSDSPGCKPFIDDIESFIKSRNILSREKSDCLSDDYNVNVFNKEKTILDRNRRWKNIYGDPNSAIKRNKHAATLLKYVVQFSLELEKHILPDIYYGRMALNYTASRNGGFNKKGTDKHNTKCVTELPGFNERKVESALQCNKINLLLRFVGLKSTQHFHRDYDGFGISVVVVLKCHEKYSFQCFRGSHELSYNNGIKDGLFVCTEDKVTIEARKGDIIVFSSNLVHAGGPASKHIGEEANLKESEVSDVSISFDFSHVGIPKGTSVTNGTTKPWPRDRIATFDKESTCYKFGGESPCFKKTVAIATSNYFDSTKGRPKSSKKQKR